MTVVGDWGLLQQNSAKNGQHAHAKLGVSKHGKAGALQLQQN